VSSWHTSRDGCSLPALPKQVARTSAKHPVCKKGWEFRDEDCGHWQL